MAHTIPRVRALLGFLVLGLFLVPAQAAPDLVVPAKSFHHQVAKSVLKSERGVTRARTVQVDLGALLAARDALHDAAPPQPMRLELFDGAVATVLITETETALNGTTTYRGHIPGRAFSSVTLVQVADVVAANIVAPDFVFQVRYSGDGLHELREIDQSQFIDHGTLKPIPVDAPPLPKDAVTSSDTGDLIDVMVAYTTAAKTGAGGLAGMNAAIALAITETNDAYAASGVTQRLRLVHSMEVVGYTEAGVIDTDLARLANTSDGLMDEVHAARNLYAADFVSLWVENGGGFCGIGYLMSTISSGFASSAFNVTARDCATGYYSFGHELGHNMGLRHDVFVDAGTTPFPHAHGYVDVPHAFRTVMAYANACGSCTRIKGFSNLTQTYTGFPMGNATADNASVLNVTAATTANFRASVPSVGFAADVAKSVSEGAGTVTLAVVRSGATTAAASVSWATASGTAVAGSDFTAASGTLSWAAGDAAAKSIVVSITQDAVQESTETFTVTLSTPVGAAISGATSTVTILDDEPGIFPVGCAIPAGWTHSAGNGTNWVATTVEFFEGTCSLRAGPIGNSQSTGIEYASTVAAGTISFRYKVSSEADFDCFKFSIDGVFKDLGGACNIGPGASGAVNWTLASYPVAAGAHTFKWLYAKDSSLAGGTDTAWIDDVRYVANTTTAVVTSLASTTLGQAVTFTATVSGGTPTGTVAFKANGTNIGGCATVVLAAGVAACTTTVLAVGTHSITVAYAGDLGHAASTSTGITQVVGPAIVLAATNTALTAPAISTTAGQAITFTATVTAAAGTPTGTVTFKDGVSAIAGCSAKALVAGSVGCTVSSLANGGHSITAEYAGDASFSASTSPARAHTVVASGPVTAAHLLWRNYANGDVYRMNVNGLAMLGGSTVYMEPATAWKIVGSGDVDGDGLADMLYRHDTNGEIYSITLTAAGTVSGKAKIHTEPNAAWRILFMADIDGDGRDDILWWNSTTGQVYVMLMQGVSIKAQGFAYTEANTSWRIAAVGDFSGSGKKNQLLWRNATTGEVYLQTLTHTGGGAFTAAGQMIYTEANAAWRILGTPDLDGNGRSDILWRNSATGQVYAMLMNGATIASQGMVYTEPNTTWKVVAWTDVNADGRADLVWRNDTSGQVYVVTMNGLAVGSQGMLYTEPNGDWKILGPWQYSQPFGGP